MSVQAINTNRRLFRTGRLAVACSLVSAAGLAAPVLADFELNDEGWSIIQPSADTEFIFVSSSTGSDSNNGRTPSQAVRSLARAKQLMRDHSSDWMLLKRGDIWAESFGSWNFSGRSEEEPVVITTYGEGDARPMIRPPSGHGIQTGFGREISHVAIVGLNFVADRPEHGSKTGIRWMSSGEGLHIEDCAISGFKDNITIQGVDQFADVVIRRTSVTDSYSVSGHSQGLFVKDVIGIKLEENIFDANGGTDAIAGAEGGGFDQNVYLQVGVLGAEFNGNIASNGPGAGAQLRSGGNAIDNLFYQNSLGLRFGYSELEWPAEYASGRIDGNVFLGGEYTGTAQQGIGLWVERFKDAIIQRNVIAHAGDGAANNVGINLAGYGESFKIQGNVVHNWTNGSTGHGLKSFIHAGSDSMVSSNTWSMEDSPKLITVKYSENMSFVSNQSFADTSNSSLFTVDGSSLSFNQWDSGSLTDGEYMGPVVMPDMDRDLGDYARSLGLADEQAFLDHARSMNRANWDSRFTGAAAARYIRAGYLTGGFADATDHDQLN